jgi:hypothetical protein
MMTSHRRETMAKKKALADSYADIAKNKKALLTIMRNEGVDIALKCAKALGYGRFEAWKEMERDLFKTK